MSVKKPREGSLAVEGRTIPFTVDYGKRKHLRIVVEAERGVEVRAPRSASFAVVMAAVQRRAGWIAGALERVRDAALLHPKPSYTEGGLSTKVRNRSSQ